MRRAPRQSSRPALILRGRSLRRLIAVAATAVTVAGCASAGPNKGQFNVVSLQEEWQLGDQLSRDVSRKMRIVTDPAANEYLNLLGQRLAAATYYHNLPWRFHIVQDPAINAFNIPGGHVYVNTGLIKATDNVAELASVVAHELGHGSRATERRT